MPDGITYVALILGFGFVLSAGTWLSAASPSLLGGLFPPQAVRDWPVGVQEPDAPRFSVAHLDALRAIPTMPHKAPPVDAIDSPQVVDLYERPVVPRSRLSRPA